jgi:hypothetical protein
MRDEWDFQHDWQHQFQFHYQRHACWNHGQHYPRRQGYYRNGRHNLNGSWAVFSEHWNNSQHPAAQRHAVEQYANQHHPFKYAAIEQHLWRQLNSDSGVEHTY